MSLNGTGVGQYPFTNGNEGGSERKKKAPAVIAATFAAMLSQTAPTPAQAETMPASDTYQESVEQEQNMLVAQEQLIEYLGMGVDTEHSIVH